MFRRGTWRPGNFPPLITLVAKLVLFGTMAVRGADYAWGDSGDTARRLSAVESAASLHVWGFACLAAAVLGFTGIYLRRSRPILIAHVIGAAIYTALAVGIVVDVTHRVPDPWATAGPTLLLLGVAAALLLAGEVKRCRDQARRRGGRMMLLAAAALTCAVGVAAYGLDGIRSATILAGIATLHILMALGTAARARQMKILEARQCG